MDIDHAGGLADFPDAQVHIFAEDHDAITRRSAMAEKGRYAPARWAHGPKWQIHEVDQGESWHGFERARPLPTVAPELLIVPVRGHTRGHSIVPVDDGRGWLVHCGDAYFDRRSISAPETVPKGIQRLEHVVTRLCHRSTVFGGRGLT